MTRIKLPFIHAFRDRHGRTRHYFRRGGKRVPLPGLPGSDEFMAAYQAALSGETIHRKHIGEDRTVPGTLQAVIAAFLDCSPTSTSPFKALAAETQRTRRNILENLREMHGDKRVYRTDQYGHRMPLLMNSTPLSIRVAINARLRDNRSSFAITNRAFKRRQTSRPESEQDDRIVCRFQFRCKSRLTRRCHRETLERQPAGPRGQGHSAPADQWRRGNRQRNDEV